MENNGDTSGFNELQQFLGLGGVVLVDNSLSISDINGLIITGKSRVWVKGQYFSEGQSLSFLKTGSFLLTGRKHQSSVLSFLKGNASHLVISGQGFSQAEVYTFLRENGQVLLDSKWDEAEILSFIKKAKSRVWIFGKGFSKYQLLIFANKGATIILDSSFDFADVINFLNQYKKFVYIDGRNFNNGQILQFLNKGGSIFINKKRAEPIVPLIQTGKERIIVYQNDLDFD